MAPINLNIAPFFDDYDDAKKFHRVLFRPGFAVQARELTQLQTILQKQVERFGSHIFAEGSMVIPGQSKFDNNVHYVKVTNNIFTDTEDAIKNNFVGQILVGGVYGVKARVVHYVPKDVNNEVYLFLKYTSGSLTDATKKVFIDSETLTVESSSTSVNALSANSTGKATLASINQGIYFTKGFFAVCDSQIAVVDKSTDLANARIGLNVIQTIIKPEDDDSLLDNATGSRNYAAPGAARLQINLVLGAKDLTTIGDPTEEENFIELLRVRNGLLEKRTDISTYSILNQTLARRTFDESGDYTVRPFILDTREFYNENNNRGVYTEENFQFTSQSEAATVAREKFNFVGIDSAITFTTGNPLRPFGPGTSLAAFKNAARQKIIHVVEPGKAYVRGFEIETISPLYVESDKARDTLTQNNQVARVSLGNYLRVTNIEGAPRLGTDQNSADTSYNNITLKNAVGLTIGTARAALMQFSQGTPNTPEAYYNLYLFDINIIPEHNFEEVFSLTQAAQGNFPIGFAADVVLVEEPFLGATVNKNNAGTVNTLVTGSNVYWATLDEQRLGVNATLKVVLSNGTTHYFVTKASPVTNQNILVDSTTTSTFTDATVSRVYAVLEDINVNKLLFSIPQGFVQSLSDVTYTCQKQYVSPTIAVGTVTISSTNLDDVFDSYNGTNYFFALDDGTLLTIQASQVSFPSATQLQIDGLSAYNGQKLVVTAAIKKTAPIVKTKTKNIGNWASRITSGTGVSGLQKLFLGKADVISIKEIRMSSDFSTAPTITDTLVTDRYQLDNGQRDMFYDISSVVLKKSAAPPTGRISVVFDWFEHGDTGTFFSVDSYIGLPYEEIPTYKNSETGSDLPLSDVIDFRPTIDSSRTIFDTPNGSISFVPTDVVSLNFSHYLNRRDKIYLTPQGDFKIRKGISAIDPSYPEDPSDSMVLYDLELRAYTKSRDDVFPRFRDNRRYTMRDIGRLEKRIQSLEYYTSLSLLEKETADLDIKDAEGADRFKNGFIVDSFRDHGIGDTNSIDYRCSIDTKAGECRPIFLSDQVSFEECSGINGFTAISEVLRNASNYTRKENLLMLNYTEVESIKQFAASKAINVNPHDVTNFIGSIKLTPSNDQWKDTERVPEAIIPGPGNFDALNTLTQGLGTIWKDWEDIPGSSSESKETVPVSVINEVFPGPAFHIDANGNPDANFGNEAMEQLRKVTSEPSTRKELHRLKKLDKQLKGEKKATKDRRERRELDNRIKKIDDRIKNTKEKLPSPSPEANKWPLRTTTLSKTITTTQKSQSRQGVTPRVRENVVQTNLGDKVVDVSFASFLRRRPVDFSGKLFKPNTKLYGFFDNQRVLLFQRNAVAGTLTFTEGSTSVSGSATAFLTDIGSGSISADTVYIQTLADGQPDLINFQNTFFTVASVTNNTALVLSAPAKNSVTVECVCYKYNVGTVTSDNTGTASGMFFTPSGVRTGLRPFKLTDSEINDNNFETTGSTIFSAQGLVEKKQNTILSTRNAEIILDPESQNKSVTDTKSDFALTQSPWVDPIAQTFLVASPEGEYITDIQVFFETKDLNIPITLEIREVVNGYPGQKVLPFARVSLEPSDVHTNQIIGANAPTADDPTDTTGYLLRDGVTIVNNFTSSDFLPTTFKFDVPVFVQGNTEYCLVVMANSIKYNLWVSEIGKRNVGTRLPITAQPYAGVLFSSQNSTTWSADQSLDVMFKVNKAAFTSNAATILLGNTDAALDVLPNNPFKVKLGSNIVKVYHPNHGFRNKTGIGNKPRVRFANCATNVGGIPFATFNNDFSNPNSYFEVTVFDLDHYTINVGTTATSSVFAGGGENIQATSDMQMDVMVPIIDNIVPDKTSLSLEYKATSGDGVHDGEFEPYVLDANWSNFSSGQTLEFDSPKMVCSSLNQVGTAAAGPVINASLVSGSKSLFVRATMSTTSANITPVIDLEKINVISIANLIDDPEPVGLDQSCVYPIDFETPASTSLTGTIGSSGVSVTGTGTLFTTQLHVGATIIAGGQLRTVATITDNLNLTVDSAFSPALSGASATSNTSTSIAFGSSTVSVITTGLLTFDAGTKSVYIHGAGSDSERAAINSLSNIKPGDLITFTGTTSTGGRVVRNLVGPDSIDIYFATDADIDNETPAAANVLRVIDSINCTNASLSQSLNTLMQIGKFINIKNSPKNSGTHKIVGYNYSAPNLEIFVEYDIDNEVAGTPITLAVLDAFIDEETSSGSTSASKYITRNIVLTNPSTALRINFLGCIPTGSRIDVFYKISRTDESFPIDDIVWQSAIFDKDVLNSTAVNEFKEQQLTIDKLPPFVGVAVKLVFLGNDSTKIPRAKDLAVIALDY